MQVVQSVVPEHIAKRRFELVPRLLLHGEGRLWLCFDVAPRQVIRHCMRAIRAAMHTAGAHFTPCNASMLRLDESLQNLLSLEKHMVSCTYKSLGGRGVSQ
jgi:hypothetical protein